MTENFENGNWVHVDSYLRNDGTRVSEYWRKKGTTFPNDAINYHMTRGVWSNDGNTTPAISYPLPTDLTPDNILSKSEDYLLKEYDKLPVPIKNFAENMIVGGVNKHTKKAIDWVGSKFSEKRHTPNAYELYKVASPNCGYNQEYVKKNGTL